MPPGDILPSTTILSFIGSLKDVILTCTPRKKSILSSSGTILSPGIISPPLKQKDIFIPMLMLFCMFLFFYLVADYIPILDYYFIIYAYYKTINDIFLNIYSNRRQYSRSSFRGFSTCIGLL